MADREHAIAMLESLSGRTHQVYTGVSLVFKPSFARVSNISDIADVPNPQDQDMKTLLSSCVSAVSSASSSAHDHKIQAPELHPVHNQSSVAEVVTHTFYQVCIFHVLTTLYCMRACN